MLGLVLEENVDADAGLDVKYALEAVGAHAEVGLPFASCLERPGYALPEPAKYLFFTRISAGASDTRAE